MSSISATAPALTGAGGTFLVRGVPEAVYEAGAATRTVVIEFPSVEAAVAAHDGAAMREVLLSHLRNKREVVLEQLRAARAEAAS